MTRAGRRRRHSGFAAFRTRAAPRFARESAREHGGILPLLLGMLLVLSAAFLGATTIGRYVLARQEAQRAADATCLALTSIIKNEGLQVIAAQESRAEIVGRANTRLPLRFDWSVPPRETAATVELTCRAVATVTSPVFVFNAGALEVGADTRAMVTQQTLTQAEKSYPQMVLVLDYSGSMQRSFDGSYTTSHDDDSFNTLVHAAQLLLNKDYDFRYGMVIFASNNLYSTPDVKLGNGNLMKDKVDDNWGCPYSGSCSTNSAGALSRAYDLLKSSSLPAGEKKYVIFVSDGEPNSTSGAKAQAERLWDLGVSIWTLHIINSTSSQTTLKNFMVSISGKPSQRGDEGQYKNASNEAALEDFFVALGAGLACGTGPVTPPPADPRRMHVFVRDATNKDLALTNAGTATGVAGGYDGVVPADDIGDLWDSREPFRNGDYFFYDPSDHFVYVTPSVCDRIQNQNQNVIIRFSSGQITQ